MQFQTLDLGCGTAKTPGSVGLDVIALSGVDIVGNLSERPYPFGPGTFDAIYLNDVIEHLPNTIQTLEELHRILKPDGRVFIRVINWNSRYAAMDPTHICYFTEKTFDFFGKRVGRSYYTRARFDVVKVTRVYNDFARALCPNDRLLHFASHFLSNVLDDLHFELRAVKTAPAPEHPVMPGAPHAWFAGLRCPVALAQGQAGLLKFRQPNWLICEESGCNYPVKNSVPCLTREMGLRWRGVAAADLPSAPAFPSVVPVEDKPIETVGVDDGFREILTVSDLAKEVLKTYGFHLPKAIAKAGARKVGRTIKHSPGAVYRRLRRVAGGIKRRIVGQPQASNSSRQSSPQEKKRAA